MSKITLDDIENLNNQTSTVASLTANNDAIEAAFNNSLSRDGTSPNAMEASLDMNSNRIINLPSALSDTEPVRKGDFDAVVTLLGDIPGAIIDIDNSVAAAAASAATASSAASSANADAAATAADRASVTNSVIGIADIINGTWPGASSITTLGTITSGIWNGTTIAVAKGGTSATNAIDARSNLGLGDLSTQSSSAVSITGGTITGLSNPTVNSDVATKNYVDQVVQGARILSSVKWATAAVLPNTPTYANGTAGVGATLTAGSNAAIAVDSGSPALNDRVLVKDQASTFQNGIYTVTTVGSGGVPWVLTRATDFDTAGEMLISSSCIVLSGTVNAGTGWSLAATVVTVGTSPATFNQYQTLAGSALVANNLSDLANASTARTNLGLAIGTNVQAFDSDLAALAANASNGIWARTGAGTGSVRTVTGTSNEITVTNGDGTSGNPTISLPTGVTMKGTTTFPGTTTITSAGKVGVGVAAVLPLTAAGATADPTLSSDVGTTSIQAGSVQLQMGIYDTPPYKAWLQGKSSANDGSSFPISLNPAGENVLLRSSGYLNYGTTSGSSGYGIHDNSGTLQAKNFGGSWTTLLPLDVTNTTYTSTGTGGSTRTGKSKWDDFIIASDYDTLAHAITQAAAVGKGVFLPPGTYTVSSTITVPASMSIIGADKTNTGIQITSATANTFDVPNGFCTIRGVNFSSSVTRTGGYYINLTSGDFVMQDVSLRQPHGGIKVNTTGSFKILDSEIVQTQDGGVSIFVTGPSGGPGASLIHNVQTGSNGNTATPCLAHIQVTNASDLLVSHSYFQGASHDMYVTPDTGQSVVTIKSINNVYDEARTSAITFSPQGTGTVLRSTFIGDWISNSHGTRTFNMAPTGGSSAVNGIELIGCEILNGNVTQTGLFMGSGVSNVVINGGKFAGHNIAIDVASVSEISILNARIGPCGPFTANVTGINLSGTTSAVLITGCNGRGNTTNYSNSASGGTIVLGSNLGIP